MDIPGIFHDYPFGWKTYIRLNFWHILWISRRYTSAAWVQPWFERLESIRRPIDRQSNIFNQASEVLRWGEEWVERDTSQRKLQEFLELTVVFLGTDLAGRHRFQFRKPGALHHARFMGKAIYYALSTFCPGRCWVFSIFKNGKFHIFFLYENLSAFSNRVLHSQFFNPLIEHKNRSWES